MIGNQFYRFQQRYITLSTVRFLSHPSFQREHTVQENGFVSVLRLKVKKHLLYWVNKKQIPSV
jgi:hypothetical protein